MEQYDELKQNLAKGWNTWNTRSVLSHVLLPEGLALNLCFKEYEDGNYLKEALIGRKEESEEKIHPIAHSYNGSYTELRLVWNKINVIVQSAVHEGELVLLVTPLTTQKRTAVLVLESGILWNKSGYVYKGDDHICGVFSDRSIKVFSTKEECGEVNVPTQTPYIAMIMEEEIGISTGVKRGLNEIKEIIAAQKEEHESNKAKYGKFSEDYNIIQTCMAWDTIYEPSKKRIVSPVSRIWNQWHGGYVLFCWDTYFAAYMSSIDNKELAYANAIEITREITTEGFIPNFANGVGIKSRDRSQPPVGSLVVKELYRRYRDLWLLEELFDDLYKWNTWFLKNRTTEKEMMAWGSNPYEPVQGNSWESEGVNKKFGAKLESGLDNSPMYDNIPFDEKTHLMELADVGLISLYIMDCDALADIADTLGKDHESKELRDRSKTFAKGLSKLWSLEKGIYLNWRTDTKEFSTSLSPTNFYPLLTSTVGEAQAKRMIKEHFYNPQEFWGDWIIPSIAKNNPSYVEQNYWRGRIWAPMNFLVYLGLRNYNLPEARKDLVNKSRELIMKEWMEHGHIHENYNGITGEGCDKSNSDGFYHWGALLSLMSLMEEGYIEGIENPLGNNR